MREPRHIELKYQIWRTTAAMLLAGAPGVATAQSDDVDEVQFTPIEQGVADLGDLGFGRVIDEGLRVPSGFERVYLLGPVDDGMRESLARRDGALTAVFPRSTYQRGRFGGLVPMVPAGTVYYIGDIPAGDIGGVGARPANEFHAIGGRATMWESGRATGQFDTHVRDQPGDSQAEVMTASPTAPEKHVLANEGYRCQRVRQLLRAAASAERAETNPQ